MPDGTVFAGISPDTYKPMYATPADASLTMTFNDAQKYAARLVAHGHQDWRLPTREELDLLFNNRAAIGGFDVTGSSPASWYWSATPSADGVHASSVSAMFIRGGNSRVIYSAVRCVR